MAAVLTADPKPAPRIVDRGASKRAKLTYTICVGCLRNAGNIHHLVPRSQGGDDVLENFVGLCGFGNTSGCHGKIHASDETTAVAIRGRLTPDQIAYIIGKKGEAWLNWKYPSAPSAVAEDS